MSLELMRYKGRSEAEKDITVGVATETSALLGPGRDANADGQDCAHKESLTNTQLMALIVNTITIRPNGRFILMFHSFLLHDLGFNIVEIGLVEAARNMGGLVAFLFPALIARLNWRMPFSSSRSRGVISYRFLLGFLHGSAGALVLSYTVCRSLTYFAVSRFCFGLLCKLFSTYKNLYIATFSATPSDWMVNYALVYLAWPMAIVYLIGFGVLLHYASWTLCIVFLSLPLIVSSSLLFVFMPDQSIDYTPTTTDETDEKKSCLAEFMYIVRDYRRSLKLVIGFLGGMKMTMFSIVLSAWFKQYFNLTSVTYYAVLLTQAGAEIIGVCFTIAYKKLKSRRQRTTAAMSSNVFDNSAVFLYTTSKGIGGMVFAVIYLSELGLAVSGTISYGGALLLVGLMYFSSILRNTCGSTLNMQLIKDVPHVRASFSAVKQSVIALGCIIGSVVASHAYLYGGMKLVSLIGAVICLTSFIMCSLLWRSMQKAHSRNEAVTLVSVQKSVT